MSEDGHVGCHHHAAQGRLGVAFALNFTFALVELVGAWLTSSTAIAADALHDLGDSFSLAFAWWMEGLAGRPPTERFTYGFRRLSLVGAFANAAVLLVGGAIVLAESGPRLWAPEQPHAEGMVGLAVLGVLVNGAAVLRLRGGESLSERVATWHLLEDLLGWVAVLIASVVMVFVDVPILDPLLAIAIILWVGANALRYLARALWLFLQAVPPGVDLEALRAVAREEAGVLSLEHLHVWSQEGQNHVLTGTLRVDCVTIGEGVALRDRVKARLREAGIGHATLELSIGEAPDCCGR